LPAWLPCCLAAWLPSGLAAWLPGELAASLPAGLAACLPFGWPAGRLAWPPACGRASLPTSQPPVHVPACLPACRLTGLPARRPVGLLACWPVCLPACLPGCLLSQSTYSQHPVNIQSTSSQHPVNMRRQTIKFQHFLYCGGTSWCCHPGITYILIKYHWIGSACAPFVPHTYKNNQKARVRAHMLTGC